MSIGSIERYPLLFGASPVHPLDRLSAHLGGASIWAKREDCNSGIAYGGNKTRKLDGLNCVLIQESWVNWPDAVYDKVGNILISRLAGADVRLVPAGFGIGFKVSWEQAVYEGKSMAGMIDLISRREIEPAATVLYAPLGGQPALNAYSALFS